RSCGGMVGGRMTSFTATSRRSTVSVARQTAPMPPLPTVARSSYRPPTTVPGVARSPLGLPEDDSSRHVGICVVTDGTPAVEKTWRSCPSRGSIAVVAPGSVLHSYLVRRCAVGKVGREPTRHRVNNLSLDGDGPRWRAVTTVCGQLLIGGPP